MRVTLDLDAEEINGVMELISKGPYHLVFKIMHQLGPQLQDAADGEADGEHLPETKIPAIQTPIIQPPAPAAAPITQTHPVIDPKAVVAPELQTIIDPDKGQLKGFCRLCAFTLNHNNYNETTDTYDCRECTTQNKTPITMKEMEKEAVNTTERRKLPSDHPDHPRNKK